MDYRLAGVIRLSLLILPTPLWLLACSSMSEYQVIDPVPVPHQDSPVRIEAPSSGPLISEGLDRVSLFNAGNRFTPWLGRDLYLGEIQPLLGKRCVSCHGCSDAPCQLKLTSWELVRRGATRISYFAARLLEAPYPQSTVRPPPFHPVVLDTGSEADNLNNSLLLAYIKPPAAADDMSTQHNPARIWNLQQELRNTAKHSCAADVDILHGYLQQNPQAGMPIGLPALSRRDYQTLQSWIAAGSPGPVEPVRTRLERSGNPEVLLRWEQFLNGTDNKTALAARYIYEHVYAANIHFDEMPGEFYRLVRSTSPPGAADIKELVTASASDRPPGKRFYYRFQKETALISRKAHIVWRVNDATLTYLDRLFIASPWLVPDADIKAPDWTRHGPHEVFGQIPAVLRYRFMLDNARMLVEAMVRGSACIGRTATYAISDHFWVFFLKPESDVSSGAGSFRIGRDAIRALGAEQDRYLTLVGAHDHYEANQVYTASYEKALRSELNSQVAAGKRTLPGLGLQDLWNGEGSNRNAWLTVLRHETSATVHHGHAGGLPQTVWVLNYANFERIYYNLVVDYKYWGSLAHKIVTWQAMSQHRLEGEDLFLSLLPESARAAMRQRYSGNLKLPASRITGLIGKPLVGRKINKLIDLYPMQSAGRPALTRLPSQDRVDLALLAQIRNYMGPVITGEDDFNYSTQGEPYLEATAPVASPSGPAASIKQWEQALRNLLTHGGRSSVARYFPGITYVRFGDRHNYQVYSFITNRGYIAHELIYAQEQARDPDRDTLSVYRGIVGDYPDLFLDVPLDKGQAFLDSLAGVSGEDAATGLRELIDVYAVARNNPGFWPFVDWLHDYMVREPDGYISAGILDLSVYDLFNR